MCLQNRVTPHGEIIADPARGTFMGNRGCLHNAQRQIRRVYQTQRWIICLLSYKGRRQVIMAPGLYTQLFFLDEATALAAGHRPCAECRRADFNAFREAWAAANPGLAGGERPLATTIDAVLHRERIDAARQKVTYRATLNQLPDGVFVTLEASEQPYLYWGGRLLAWAPAGYSAAVHPQGDQPVTVLTPRSTAGALARGYRPVVHETAGRLERS